MAAFQMDMVLIADGRSSMAAGDGGSGVSGDAAIHLFQCTANVGLACEFKKEGTLRGRKV